MALNSFRNQILLDIRIFVLNVLTFFQAPPSSETIVLENTLLIPLLKEIVSLEEIPRKEFCYQNFIYESTIFDMSNNYKS